MDKMLEMLFEPERWEYALEKGVDKEINQSLLRSFTSPEMRACMYRAIRDGKYEIMPPHTALIPKDTPGEFRTVYVNEGVDRILLSIINDMLFEMMPEMVHPSCKSYQKGIGCGKVVQKASAEICKYDADVIGYKADLSKYFDSVPLEFIDWALDRVEAKHGKSKVIDVVRKYYHCDLYFDTDNVLQKNYQSLKQGCAVASWLADVILYDMDEMLTNMRGYYVRYSDDILYVGGDYESAMEIMRQCLSVKGLKLNPKKVEYLSKDRYFKFLGFSIKGKDITLSSTRIKTFQKEIEKRTIKQRNISPERALNQVNRYLYKGDGEHSWATQVLGIVNVDDDIKIMNEFVMDCLRAVQTNRKKVGGLGYVPTNKACIVRGIGKNVKANRLKTAKMINGYYSLNTMRKAMLCTKSVYDTLVMQM